MASRRASQTSVLSGYSQTQSQNNRQRSHSTRSNNVSIRSFSDFLAQTASNKPSSPPSIRRKPVPTTASVRKTSTASRKSSLNSLLDDYADSPDLGNVPIPVTVLQQHSQSTSQSQGQEGADPHMQVFLTLQRPSGEPNAQGSTTDYEHSLPTPFAPRSSSLSSSTASASLHLATQQPLPRQRVSPPPTLALSLQPPRDATNGPDATLKHAQATFDIPDINGGSPLFNVPFLTADDMSLYDDGLPRSVSDHSIGSDSTNNPSQRRTSPTSKFSSFFGWKTSPKTGQDSPTTPFTDRSVSPAPSPVAQRKLGIDRSASAPRLGVPTPIDVRAANSTLNYGAGSPYTPFPGNMPEVQTPMAELERELREVSAELASSIRREMELEDENDRLKAEPSTYPDATRRTSDYFSDSGLSSAKVSTIESDNRIEELEKAQRRLEQEKAQLRAEYSARFATEMRLRNDMQTRIAALEREAKDTGARAAAGTDSEQRIKELETFLEEARRRLGQERQSHDNFEDLLAALRGELTQMRGERDNLVDEVIPQLKARVAGLEQEAAEVTNLRYENARIQQEMDAELPHRPRLSSLAGGERAWGQPAGLARSPSSFSAFPSPGLGRSKSVLNRSSSIKGRSPNPELGESNEVEDQRDALHKALRAMIIRMQAEKREHARAMQRLLVERSQTTSSGPRSRKGFTQRVVNVKEDMAALRRRADDALTQKWQCEDNFGAVKMALDRTDSEIRAARAMLGANGDGGLGINVPDESDASMLKIIRRSIQLAQTERDAARREAVSCRARATSSARSSELTACAAQLDTLATELDACVAENLTLQSSLSSTLDKVTAESSASTNLVTDLQSRLRQLEDALSAAQSETDARLAQADDVVRTLARSTGGVTRLALSSINSNSRALVTPPAGQSLAATLKTGVFEHKVQDLERAVLAADRELQGVMRRVEDGRQALAAKRGEREAAGRNMKELQARVSEAMSRALGLAV